MQPTRSTSPVGIGSIGSIGISTPPPRSASSSRHRRTPSGGSAGASPCRLGHTAGVASGGVRRDALQDYVQQLENQLAVKTGLLDEALRLHRLFHGRLVTLSEGLAWKDQQLEQLARSEQNAWRQAAKDTQDCRQWRRRAEHLEEENSALRDELLESSENNLRLRQFLEVLEVQAVKGYGLRSRTLSQQLVEETKEPRKSEEIVPSSVSSHVAVNGAVVSHHGTGTMSGGTTGHGALHTVHESAKLSFFLTGPEAWAQVGSSAADRLCGVNLERLKVDEAAANVRPLERVDETKLPEDSVSSKVVQSQSRQAASLSPKRGSRGEASRVSPGPCNGPPQPQPVRYMSATQLSALAAVPAAAPAAPMGGADGCRVSHNAQRLPTPKAPQPKPQPMLPLRSATRRSPAR